LYNVNIFVVEHNWPPQKNISRLNQPTKILSLPMTSLVNELNVASVKHIKVLEKWTLFDKYAKPLLKNYYLNHLNCVFNHMLRNANLYVQSK